MNRQEILQIMNNFDVSTDEGQFVFSDYLEEQGELEISQLCRLFTESNRNWLDFGQVFPLWIKNSVEIGLVFTDPTFWLDKIKVGRKLGKITW